MNLKNTSSYLFALSVLVSAIAIKENVKANIIVAETLDHVSHVNKYNASKSAKQISLLKLTLSQIEQQSVAKNNIMAFNSRNYNGLYHIEKFRFLHAHAKPVKKLSIVDFDQLHAAFSAVGTTEFDNQNDTESSYKLFPETPIAYNKKNIDLHLTGLMNEAKSLQKAVKMNRIGYWQTVYSIESKQGKLLYRPSNKSRNCTYTSAACGHHQLTIQALKDIGCHSLQCRKDRLNYEKSLKLSKKLLALNEKRLRKSGVSKLRGYQKYLIHQQGAYGIKNIIAATQGKKQLSKNIKKNMANNSPFSFKQLKNMDSKAAANKFMQHWKSKWLSEKRLIVSSQATTAVKTTGSLVNTNFIPTFDDSQINLALNIRF